MDNFAAFQQAIKFLNEHRFVEAYPLLTQCIGREGISQPDLLFNCGWCLENIGNDRNQMLSHYLLSHESAQNDELKLHAGFRYSWILIQEKNYPKAQCFLSKISAETLLALNESPLLRNVTYWLAVCLEHEGRYLDAIEYYEKVEPFTDEGLALEARYRKIMCLSQVGKLDAALQNAEVFLNFPLLSGNEGMRQSELANLVKIEKSQIERALEAA